MAHLPNLGRLPLHPTGVIGDETPDVDWEERANLRRFKYEYAEALEDPQLHYRKMLATTTNGGREFTVVGNPVKISGFHDTNWRPPVAELNEHGAKL